MTHTLNYPDNVHVDIPAGRQSLRAVLDTLGDIVFNDRFDLAEWQNNKRGTPYPHVTSVQLRNGVLTLETLALEATPHIMPVLALTVYNNMGGVVLFAVVRVEAERKLVGFNLSANPDEKDALRLKYECNVTSVQVLPTALADA